MASVQIVGKMDPQKLLHIPLHAIAEVSDTAGDGSKKSRVQIASELKVKNEAIAMEWYIEWCECAHFAAKLAWDVLLFEMERAKSLIKIRWPISGFWPRAKMS